MIVWSAQLSCTTSFRLVSGATGQHFLAPPPTCQVELSCQRWAQAAALATAALEERAGCWDLRAGLNAPESFCVFFARIRESCRPLQHLGFLQTSFRAISVVTRQP